MSRPRRRATLVLERVTKTYGTGEIAVHALRDIDLRVERGDYLAIMGASGSGKSTLMNLIGCLDVPTAGRLSARRDRRQRPRRLRASYVRNRKIGFVFQSFNLIPRTSALRNVELPLIYARTPQGASASGALEALGGGRSRRPHAPRARRSSPAASSSASRSRARSSPSRRSCSPTSRRATSTARRARRCSQIFARLNASGRTIVMITHEPDVAAYAKRVDPARGRPSSIRRAPRPVAAPSA